MRGFKYFLYVVCVRSTHPEINKLNMKFTKLLFAGKPDVRVWVQFNEDERAVRR